MSLSPTLFLLLLLLLSLLSQELTARGTNRSRRELSPGLHRAGIRDPGGAYCSRLGACCPGRSDTCTVPYIDTICYCDLFCNRTVSDCCPDFWAVCLGTKPGRDCVRHGQIYPPGTTYKDNCNYCSCSDGRWSCDQHACLINQEMIDNINRGRYGWWASNYTQFWGMTLEEGICYRLGTIRPSATVMNMNQLNVHMERNEQLPTYFNAADKWPGMIHEPMDQGNCAASWAFSTAAVASDRIAIHSMGHMSPVLSPQNLISCDTRNQQGCEGGRLDGAWWYLRRRGLVTNNCYPFSSTESQPLSPQCMMSTRSAGRGKRQATMPCPNPYTHSNEIYQSTPAYRLSTNEKEIMKELMENGPVQVRCLKHVARGSVWIGSYQHGFCMCHTPGWPKEKSTRFTTLMEVHEDFFVYRSGIYRHVPVTTGAPENHRRHGTHSVRIIGWGEQITANGEISKYWIAANSWGRNWGEGGYFKIARGENECDIEMFIVGTWGRVSMEDMHHK